MTAIIIFLIAVIILLGFCLICPSSGGDEEIIRDFQPPVPPQKTSNGFERNHFINKHLHRDDEKHARHKQNQTPW